MACKKEGSKKDPCSAHRQRGRQDKLAISAAQLAFTGDNGWVGRQNESQIG